MFIAGGLGANPHPALALEEFTAARRPAAHASRRSCGFRPPRQPRQQAAGPPEVARRHHRHRRAARAHPQGAQVPARVVHAGRAASPTIVEKHGDAPAGMAHRRSPPTAASARATPVQLRGIDAVRALGRRQRRARRRQGHRVSAYAYAPPRRHHLRPVPRPRRRSSASFGARGPRHQPPELRVPRPHRGRSSPTLLRPARRHRHGRARRRAGPRRRRLPRRRHLQPRRHAVAAASPTPSATRSRRPGLAEVGGVRINISGCTNSCGQHHIADIGFFGARAPGPRPVPPPATRCCSAATSATWQIDFGEKASQLPAKNAPEAAVRVVGRFADERDAGETFRVVARPLRRRQGASATTLDGPRRLPHPRRGARLLRRLRRDRPLRGRDRRRRSARHDALDPDATSTASSSTYPTSPSWPRCRPSSSSGPRRRRSSGRGRRFGDRAGARGVVPGLRAHRPRHAGRPRDRGRVPRHAVPLPGDALVRRAGARALRPQPARSCSRAIAPDDLWQIDPDNCCSCARSSRSTARSTARRRG